MSVLDLLKRSAARGPGPGGREDADGTLPVGSVLTRADLVPVPEREQVLSLANFAVACGQMNLATHAGPQDD